MLAAVDGAAVLFYRPVGVSPFRSSEAWAVPDQVLEDPGDPAELAGRLRGGEVDGARILAGFDTYWYTWVGVNRETRLPDR